MNSDAAIKRFYDWEKNVGNMPPNPKADERRMAMQIRRQWLAKMGLSQAEIDESVRDDPPTDANLERKQLAAIERIQREQR
jgi:hypothetical protein